MAFPNWLARGSSRAQVLPKLAPELLIANTVLAHAFSRGVEISHLKLQKIVYFVYKKYLQDTGRPLFGDFFEVWKFGPVLPTIYHAFKKYGSNNLTDFAYATLDAQKKVLVASRNSKKLYAALNWVWTVYGGYEASALVDLTHRPNTAWYNANERKEAYLCDEEIMQEGWLLQ